MNKPLTSQEPPELDRTKYNGPQGAAPPGSGLPHSEEEERAMLARADEADRQETEHRKAQTRLARLSRRKAAAISAHDVERAQALEEERQVLVAEIKNRFGY